MGGAPPTTKTGENWAKPEKKKQTNQQSLKKRQAAT